MSVRPGEPQRPTVERRKARPRRLCAAEPARRPQRRPGGPGLRSVGRAGECWTTRWPRASSPPSSESSPRRPGARTAGCRGGCGPGTAATTRGARSSAPATRTSWRCCGRAGRPGTASCAPHGPGRAAPQRAVRAAAQRPSRCRRLPASGLWGGGCRPPRGTTGQPERGVGEVPPPARCSSRRPGGAGVGHLPLRAITI